MAVLDVERLGRVRRLTLNRPDRSNALNLDLLTALAREVDAAADDPDTSVVVLRGAGRGFSAGFDLAAGYGQQDLWADRERLRRSNRALEAVWDCPLPVVAAVHGFCLAGGADLALHCDLMVVTHSARVGYPPVRNLGVPPTNMWLYRLGPQLAKRLLLTGDSLTGEEAARVGLAVQSCEDGELDRVALDLAERIALSGRELLIGNKAVVNRGIDLMGRAVLARIAETEDALGHTSPPARAFRDAVGDRGVARAVRERDAPFQPDPPGIVIPRPTGDDPGAG